MLQVLEEDRREKREQECTLAKARLKNYEYADELMTKDKDGKERTLSKSEYKQAVEDAKKAIEYWCR